MKEKKLVRPEQGKVFFGVAKGIADYFEIDPVIVRIIFVILTLWDGLGIILYIVGIIAIPSSENSTNIKKDETKLNQSLVKNEKSDNTKIFGLLLILLGVVILLQNLIPQINFAKFWPVILVALGLAILINNSREKK